MKNPSTHQRKGFTLVELLVAMMITTIIITILISVTSLSLDTWNRSRSEIRAARQAKAMIDSMTRDLESMVVRKGNNFEWLLAKCNPPTGGPNGNSATNAADLVFFTAATDRYNGNIGDANLDKGGDVSTVAYQLTYKDPITAATTDKLKTFVFYRKIINPKETFSETLATPFDSGSPDSTTLLTKATAAPSDPSITGNAIDTTGNFICENIYQFTLTFHVTVTLPTGKQVVVPVQLGTNSNSTDIFKLTGSGLHMENTMTASNGITNDMLKAGRLTSVEVSLTVLTDFGLGQMRTRTFSGTQKDDFIAKNSYQYSKIIPVPGS